MQLIFRIEIKRKKEIVSGSRHLQMMGNTLSVNQKEKNEVFRVDIPAVAGA